MRLTDDFRHTRCIGITGGVGAGKSSVITYLKEKTGSRVFNADEEAKKLYLPGNPVFDRIISVTGTDVLDEGGMLDRERFAARLFDDGELKDKINSIVHPAVKGLILDGMALERAEGKRDFYFIEAALLIECGYEEHLDELWYVYASEETRIKRLRDSRGYTDEKIRRIFDSQLSDKEYRKHCKRVIDNDGSPDDMKGDVDKILKEVLGN